MSPTANVASALEHEAMLRALDIASQGPSTGANPQVGCVLINADGVIVSEGFHLGSGTPHAEVVALESLRSAGIDPKGLTAVVIDSSRVHRRGSGWRRRSEHLTRQ